MNKKGTSWARAVCILISPSDPKVWIYKAREVYSQATGELLQNNFSRFCSVVGPECLTLVLHSE